MESLIKLINSMKQCDACSLMRENEARGIPFVPIFPKPHARLIFIGRDPSPRTASIVGVRVSKSSFINEIFRIVDEAGVSEDSIYITDV